MNNSKAPLRTYFTKPAENWVSKFVLLGCIAICCTLVYSAFKARVIGGKLSLSHNEEIQEMLDQPGS